MRPTFAIAAACGLAFAVNASGQCDPLWSRPGPISYQYSFGLGVYTIGDVTGDAVPDVIAIDTETDSYWFTSRLLSGADGTYLGKIPDPWEEGWEIAPIGDSDGDGIAEWVGSGTWSVVSLFEGITLVREFEAPGITLTFGYSLCTVPDWDGDGADDILASDFDYKVGGVARTGRVLLFSTLTGEVLHTIEGAPGEYLARGVSRVGDVNGDGVDDITIKGDRLYVYSGADLSRLYGIFVSGARVTALPVGDIDGDGAADFVASDTTGDGEVLLISGIDGNTIASVSGTPDQAITGVASAGDWDRDGVPDVAAGAADGNAGRVTIYSGQDLRIIGRILGAAPGEGFGNALDVIEFPGADSPVLAIGAPGYDNSLGIVRAIPGSCRADFNCDGATDTRDVIAFLGAFAAGDLAADANFDDEVNSLDVLEFLNLWTRGC